MNFVDLLYSDGAVRHTAKRNLLNEIKIKRYSQPSLMGNPILGAIITDVMATFQFVDYRMFKRFSNVADEISTKLLSTPLEVLVVVSDQYDFEFSIKTAEKKLICRKVKLSINKSFQNHLGNSNNKTNLVKCLF